MYRQFRVCYLRKEQTDTEFKFDETEFDVEDGDFVSMFNELTDLFNVFCNDEKYISAKIIDIEEVKEM